MADDWFAQNAPKQSAPPPVQNNQDWFAANAPQQPKPETGVFASVKRNVSGIVHLPGAIYDAFTKPPQNDFEQRALQLGGPAELGIKRLLIDPSTAEFGKAIQAHAQAQQGKPEFGEPGNTGHPILDQTIGRFIDLGDKGTGPGNPAAEHLANMHAIGATPVIGPIASDITQRFLSGDKSGAATDVAMMVAGPKIAEKAVGAGVKAAGSLATGTAERLYQSALKPSTTLSAAQKASLLNTGLQSGIPISEAGMEKLSTLIDDLNGKIADQIKAGNAAGATVNPEAVANRLEPLKERFSNQVNPSSDLAAIDAAKQEFLSRFGQMDDSGRYAYRVRDAGETGVPSSSHSQATLSPEQAKGYIDSRGKIQGKPQEMVKVDLTKLNPQDYELMPAPGGTKWVKFTKDIPETAVEPAQAGIPVEQAQALKQGTYQQLKGRAYGELKSATIESQKALARGIKEELEAQFPEIKGMNAQESKLIGLDGALEKALNRIGNRQLVGIGTPIVMGAVGSAAGGGPGIVAGMVKAIVDDPLVKSKLAIALSRAGKVPPSAAIGKITQYANLLGQSQRLSYGVSGDF